MRNMFKAVALTALFTSSVAMAQEPITLQEYQLESGVLNKEKASLIVFPGANTDGSDLRCLRISQKSGYAGMGGLSCHWSGTPTKSAVQPAKQAANTQQSAKPCVGRGCK